MKKIRISVYWPDDWKSVVLTESEWQSLKNGEPLSMDGEGYSYEGEDFDDWWEFEGGMEGNVSVTYNDGGEGYSGPLSECEIEELED